MKAQKPEAIRPVKVKSLMGMTSEEVQEEMWQNSINGRIPKWKEILEEDTPEMDTETLFDAGYTELYQTTVPFPKDTFPDVMKKFSATRLFNYCLSVCKREGWKPIYPNLMAVVNQLDMEM